MHSHVSAAAYVPSFALASRQSKQSSETTKTLVNKEVAQQETSRAEAGEVRYAMSTTAADYVPTRYALHATMQRRVERTTLPTNITQTKTTYTAPPRPMLLTSDEYSFLFATLSWNADLLLILLRNAASPLATPVIPVPVTPTVNTAPTRLTWSQLLTSSPASRLAQQQQQQQRCTAPPINTCRRDDEREEVNRHVGALDARAFPTLLEAQRRWQSEKRRRPQPRVTDTALVGPDEDVLECEEGEDDVVDEEDHHVNNKEGVSIVRRQPMSHAARRRHRRRGGGMATRHTRAHTLTCRPGPTSTEGNEGVSLENIDESKPRWLMEQLGLLRGTRPQSLYTIPDEAAEQLYQELMTLTHLTRSSSSSPEASDDTVLCEKEDRANALRDALVRMGPDAMSDLYFQPWLLAQVVRSLRGEDVDDDDAKEEKKGGDRTDALDDDNNSNDDEAYDDGESEALFYLSRRSRRRYKLVPGTTGDPRRKAQHVYYGPRIAHTTSIHTTAVVKPLASAAATTAQSASTVKEATTVDTTVPVSSSSSSTKEQIDAQPVINNIKAPAAPATQGIEFFVQMFLRAVLIVVIVQVRLNQASSTLSSTAPTPHSPSHAIVSSTTTLSAVERRALSFVRRYLPPFRALVTRYVMRCEVEVMRRAAQPLFMPPPSQSANINAQVKVSEELLSSSGSDADGGSGEVPQRERLRHSAASPAREESPSSTTATLFASDWLHDVLSEPYVSQGMHYVNSTLQRHSTTSLEWAPRPLWTEQLYLSGKDAAWQPLLLELLDITRVVQCYADSSPAPHASVESQETTGNVSGATQAASLPHRELLFRALTALLTLRLTPTSPSANNSHEGAASISVEEEESEDYLAYLQPYLTPHSAMPTNEEASMRASSSGAGVVLPSTSLLAPLRWQLYATLPSHYDTNATNNGDTSCKHNATSYESGSESGVYSQLYVTTLPLSGRLLVRWVLPAEDDSRYNLARFFEPRLFAFLQGGPLPAPTQSAVMPLLLFHAQQHAQGGSIGRRESALVHCSAGMHRSCGIVVAFLLWLVVQCRIVMQAAQPRLLPTQCCASLGSLQDVLTMCLRHVQAQRSMAEPIPAVVQQLQGFAERLGNSL